MVRGTGRNDVLIVAALEVMAQTMQNQNQPNAENTGTRSLATFQRENPPVFKGKYNPDGALEWLKEIERIFRVMDYTQDQKVRYRTHMLAAEADDWWLETRQRLEVAGEDVTWAMFRRDFMRKYYPEDVRGKKEVEFLELKQGNLSVTEYAAKFTELEKFYPHYDGEGAEFLKCIKFVSGLRYEIKKAVDIRKSVSFQIWLTFVVSLKKTIMLIIRWLLIEEVSQIRIVASLMTLQQVKENRKLRGRIED